MKSPAPDEPPPASADAPGRRWEPAEASPGWSRRGAAAFVRKTAVIAEMDLRKLWHDPFELATRAIQPALWLLIFGEVFTRIRAIPTGDFRYLDFMAPGILAQSVLFIAIFFGIAVIWERDLGLVHKLVASPAPRLSLVAGKGLAAGIRGLSQAFFVYGLAWLLGVKLNWAPQALAGVMIAVLLGAGLFATFSLGIACIVKTRERFMGIGQVLTMPLFFASNAVYPVSIMPGWLKVLAHINPLTYEVDALRAMMLRGGSSLYGLGTDFAVLLGGGALLTVIAARLYPRIVV
ncbi:MAG TPA: ABC transporter permease [Opitutaceae bacterium]|nr:ABC transporter permease [Opitutaceae bacterium]